MDGPMQNMTEQERRIFDIALQVDAISKMERREKERDRQKRYRQRHPEKNAENSRRSRERHPETRAKYCEENKDRVREAVNNWYLAHREERLLYYRAYGKGITVNEVRHLLLVQKECEVCGFKFKDESKVTKGHIDHDHDTGEVRGILCNRCNRAIGMFSDDSDVMRKAADYLDRCRDLVDFSVPIHRPAIKE